MGQLSLYRLDPLANSILLRIQFRKYTKVIDEKTLEDCAVVG
ncbi:hypothetical protein HanXRQr2_Chr12g0523151 [Helianthus annuus]|uniref:Uncharacterized protein n=1 Tax=Helianthus annuus TaxID=4232 RepID=A0A9K3HEG7_HELAN|nr:hypothetical protein HanXRQr2_Chr12g0523151 [Helianthus annuus]